MSLTFYPNEKAKENFSIFQTLFFVFLAHVLKALALSFAL